MIRKNFFLLVLCSASLYAAIPWYMQQKRAQPIEHNHHHQPAHKEPMHKKMKYLHITFHRGCMLEVDRVAKSLDVDVTPWFIFDRPLEDLEGKNAGLYVYNITHERAQRIWDKHKDYFNQFDAIITSDTAPLSRIFLQNNWSKPLIIWICNRFDFFFSPTHTPIDFPDDAYYRLFQDAARKDNVFMVSYTPYEWYFALKKGVDIGLRTIKPIGVVEDGHRYRDPKWSVPHQVEKKNTIFIYPSRISQQEMELIKQQCDNQGITTYSGRYNGPSDLADFKGVLYWPYQWSNLCLFENWHRGLVHFVPSVKLLKQLKDEGKTIPAVLDQMMEFGAYQFNEWYAPEHKDLIVYFDSWQDLKEKIETTDYQTLSTRVRSFAQKHKRTMMQAWRELFDDVEQQVYAQ